MTRQRVVILVGLLAFILVPFALFDEPMSAWTLERIRGNPQVSFAWIALALALDVFLPIPSSIVSTLAGTLLGFPVGMLASAVGMTAGSILGYWFGRAVVPEETGRAFALQQKYGVWALLISRGIPVLAEASVMVAGFSRMPFGRFLAVTTLANVAVSAVYAWIGSAIRW
ncbi:hypothetical protein F183_A24600 [Bryobacterales bacterium F-183]|nr:hypothetical protein F183_A24600 [Bryobacterales bacterium F-183]